MSKLEMCDIQKKHYEVWIELYHKYAEYYQVDIPKDNFDLTFTIDEVDMELIENLDRGGSVTWEYGDPLAIK